MTSPSGAMTDGGVTSSPLSVDSHAAWLPNFAMLQFPLQFAHDFKSLAPRDRGVRLFQKRVRFNYVEIFTVPAGIEPETKLRTQRGALDPACGDPGAPKTGPA
jgi:hypothetical protein